MRWPEGIAESRQMCVLHDMPCGRLAALHPRPHTSGRVLGWKDRETTSEVRNSHPWAARCVRTPHLLPPGSTDSVAAPPATTGDLRCSSCYFVRHSEPTAFCRSCATQVTLDNETLAVITTRLGGPWVKPKTWRAMGWLADDSIERGRDKRRRDRARRARMQRMRDACKRMSPWLCPQPATWTGMFPEVLCVVSAMLSDRATARMAGVCHEWHSALRGTCMVRAQLDATARGEAAAREQSEVGREEHAALEDALLRDLPALGEMRKRLACRVMMAAYGRAPRVGCVLRRRANGMCDRFVAEVAGHECPNVARLCSEVRQASPFGATSVGMSAQSARVRVARSIVFAWLEQIVF